MMGTTAMKRPAVVDLDSPKWRKVDEHELKRFTSAVSENVVKPVAERTVRQREEIARIRNKSVR